MANTVTTRNAVPRGVVVLFAVTAVAITVTLALGSTVCATDAVERVTGRRTWGSVLGQGAVSGLGMGLLVGLMMMFFTPGGAVLSLLLTGLIVGVVIGMITAAITYSMSGGERDFNSVQQVVATHYEVLAEHKVAAQAREMVSDMPFMRAKAFEG